MSPHTHSDFQTTNLMPVLKFYNQLEIKTTNEDNANYHSVKLDLVFTIQ